MSITAVVEKDTIKLPPGIHLPDGTKVVLDLPDAVRVSTHWPAGYFERTAGALAGEVFERPPQDSTPEERETAAASPPADNSIATERA
jgi:hypothetical protein